VTYDIGTRHGAVEKTRPATDGGAAVEIGGVGSVMREGDAAGEGDASRELDATALNPDSRWNGPQATTTRKAMAAEATAFFMAALPRYTRPTGFD
jgi:hypothetical protein